MSLNNYIHLVFFLLCPRRRLHFRAFYMRAFYMVFNSLYYERILWVTHFCWILNCEYSFYSLHSSVFFYIRFSQITHTKAELRVVPDGSECIKQSKCFNVSVYINILLTFHSTNSVGRMTNLIIWYGKPNHHFTAKSNLNIFISAHSVHIILIIFFYSFYIVQHFYTLTTKIKCKKKFE